MYTVCLTLQLGEEHERTKESSECLKHLTQQAVVFQKKMNEIYKGEKSITFPPLHIQTPSVASVLDTLNVINGIVFVQIRYLQEQMYVTCTIPLKTKRKCFVETQERRDYAFLRLFFYEQIRWQTPIINNLDFFKKFVSQEDIEKFRQQVSLKGVAKTEEPEKPQNKLTITEVPEDSEEAKLPNSQMNGDIAHSAGPREVTVGGEWGENVVVFIVNCHKFLWMCVCQSEFTSLNSSTCQVRLLFASYRTKRKERFDRAQYYPGLFYHLYVMCWNQWHWLSPSV